MAAMRITRSTAAANRNMLQENDMNTKVPKGKASIAVKKTSRPALGNISNKNAPVSVVEKKKQAVKNADAKGNVRKSNHISTCEEEMTVSDVKVEVQLCSTTTEVEHASNATAVAAPATTEIEIPMSVVKEEVTDVKVEVHLHSTTSEVEHGNDAAAAAAEIEVPMSVVKEEVTVKVEHVPDAASTLQSTDNVIASEEEHLPMDVSVVSVEAGDVETAFSTHIVSTVEDIDRDDAANPQLISIYACDIYDYLRQLEAQYPISQTYLRGKIVTGNMRGILLNWLVDVHRHFHLLQETLYMTTMITDRYLQLADVAKEKLQLVGVTAMLIACKYEEIYAPEIADFVYITDNAYSASEIRQMECAILKSLKFELGRPLAIHFLRRNSKAADVDEITHTVAKYLTELTLIDYEMVHIPPSKIAAGALCLTMKLLSDEIRTLKWTDTLSFHSKYCEIELMPVMRRMAELVLRSNSGRLVAVHRKYESSKFRHVANLPQLRGLQVEHIALSA